MYQLTMCNKVLLDYLKNVSMPSLPVELWDKQLWFYSKLLTQFEKPFMLSEKQPQNLNFYINEHEGQVLGIACCELHEDFVSLMITASSEIDITELIEQIKNHYELPLRVSTIDVRLGDILANTYGYPLQKDYVEYYYKSAYSESDKNFLSQSENRCIPVTLSIVDKYACDHLKSLLSQELQCYARVDKGQIVSICAAAPITIQRAQLFGLHTCLEENRRKGYAREVCLHTLHETCKHFDVVTIKVDVENSASMKIAHQLNFEKMYVITFFDIE